MRALLARLPVRLPLRLRLTLAFCLAMATVLTALGAFLYTRMGTELTRAVDLDLRARAAATVGSMAQRERAPLDAGSGLIDPDESFGQILTPHGDVVETTPAVAAAPMLPPGTTRTVTEPVFLSRHVVGLDDPARLLALPVQLPGTVEQPAVLVVGAPLGDRAEALDRLLLLLLIGGPLALAASSYAGWLLAGAALRPVGRIRREAAAISETEPERRLTVPPTGDELARLAHTLNAMLARLQEALEREHRFVDTAGHELRTPLALLRAELELATARPRDRAELEAALRSAATETDRLVGLAEDLLVLARTRQGRLPLRREPVPLPRLLTDAAEAFRARATAEGATLTVETSTAPEATADADPVRLRQVLHNLLDNALRHSGPSGPGHIVLSTERADSAVKLCVGDEGLGFPPAMLAGPPPGPSADESAGGLGLAIVAMIAAAHGGRVSLANRPSGGALVTVSLIAAPVQGSGAECPSAAVGSCVGPAEAAGERGAHSSPSSGAESTHPRPM
ncbi:ATP-binding protein [Streptomyces sp. NPDC048751]|uniref:HAMP domain-containing sensor histidine kinase n=1 Tax=Streptomyces sp. NPDC048751 TaxID=3365591 RepID=UPI0037124E3E